MLNWIVSYLSQENFTKGSATVKYVASRQTPDAKPKAQRRVVN